MKTLTQTIALSFIFSTTLLFSNAPQAEACSYPTADHADSSKTDNRKESLNPSEDEFDFNFEDPFFFNDKIIVHVYNQQDELVFSECFNKEESQEDADLRDILKKSEFMLSIGNQYYYYTKQ